MQALTVVGIILEIIVLFNFVIVVHELGHYWAARWRGLKVEKFQIWFGKPIWSKTVNGVQWGLGWIPAGGFVALPQMNPMEMLSSSTAEPGQCMKKPHRSQSGQWGHADGDTLPVALIIGTYGHSALRKRPANPPHPRQPAPALRS